jgi:hypothetical protein
MNPWKNSSKKRKEATALGFRSGLEKDTYDNLLARGVQVVYESREVKFTETKERTYHPDFQLPNGILVETKGRFVTADRQKMLAIKKQYPDLDIRIVFSNSSSTISKASKTTYGQWASKAGIPWADKVVPQSWVDEPATEERTKALNQYTTLTPDKKRGKLE